MCQQCKKVLDDNAANTYVMRWFGFQMDADDEERGKPSRFKRFNPNDPIVGNLFPAEYLSVTVKIISRAYTQGLYREGPCTSTILTLAKELGTYHASNLSPSLIMGLNDNADIFFALDIMTLEAVTTSVQMHSRLAIRITWQLERTYLSRYQHITSYEYRREKDKEKRAKPETNATSSSSNSLDLMTEQAEVLEILKALLQDHGELPV
ncbi:hypothetical protein BDY19DRAFT_1047753 [Irpex rosettiformis]|uniref:Uncharacterized protein n=1 Tax=Irpex rosettiformis TaxID=378272 RepID=A0ACB8U731_9APHY|nr:hypothetical protein BDY19DRAFT_1047753 [Irpex rosettiformis]